MVAAPTIRALAVDDDPAVLSTLALTLGRLGYVVDTAGSYSEAETLARGIDYNLVLTDLRMKDDNSGARLLELVAEVQPSARRVLMTGGAPPRGHHAQAVLAKPFGLDELRVAVEACGTPTE